ncbi:MAG TPA: ribbon-helix-helix protein, CopG family [Nitrospirae bacterium]|nr:ribbon-helix-helix protein, CopG family [Nitrospirota bacterium]
MKGKNLTITVPKKLVKKIDNLIEEEYYSSRSEFFKDAARRVLERRPRVVE